MAKPQKENGYVAIANEIVEALAKTSIDSQPRRILDFILRKTYGFNKKRDAISLSQFSTGTGLKQSNVCRAIKILENMKIIITIKDKGNITEYEFQKDYDKWTIRESRTRESRTRELGSPVHDNQGVPPEGHTKDTSTKDNTKDIKPKASVNAVLPDWIDKDAWIGYLEMRQSIRKPLKTERAIKGIISKLEHFKKSGQDINKILDQSTMNSWQGIFPLKEDYHARSQNGGSGRPRNFAAEQAEGREKFTRERNARILSRGDKLSRNVHREEIKRAGGDVVDGEACEVPEEETSKPV